MVVMLEKNLFKVVRRKFCSVRVIVGEGYRGRKTGTVVDWMRQKYLKCLHLSMLNTGTYGPKKVTHIIKVPKKYIVHSHVVSTNIDLL